MVFISELKQGMLLSSHLTLTKPLRSPGIAPPFLWGLPAWTQAALWSLSTLGELPWNKVKSVKDQGGQLPDFSMLEVWAATGAIPRVGDSSRGLMS